MTSYQLPDEDRCNAAHQRSCLYVRNVEINECPEFRAVPGAENDMVQRGLPVVCGEVGKCFQILFQVLLAGKVARIASEV